MNRSGYCDDYIDQWDLIRWRGAVASAIRGKRGQAMLVEMRDALDSMPDKRLITNSLSNEDGEYCALGCLGAKRGLDLNSIDPEDPEQVAKAFGVSEALVREIAWENDACDSWSPEKRWQYMRNWLDRHIQNDNTNARNHNQAYHP